MKPSRSAGVIASAVVLILISAMTAFGGVGVLAGFVTVRIAGAKVLSSIPTVVATGAALLVVAGWGIATGVGLLRGRGWAWVSVLILAVLLAFASFPSLAAEPRLIRTITGIPTVGAFPTFISAQFGLVPLPLAVWWIVYFTRKSVRAQFGFASVPSTVKSQ